MEYERRGEALLRGPLGCALLLDVATNLGYPFDFFADPAVSFWLAGTAADWCDPWGNAYQLDWALQDGAGCSDLALAIGQDPAFAWWWDPLDLETQVWVSGGCCVAMRAPTIIKATSRWCPSYRKIGGVISGTR